MQKFLIHREIPGAGKLSTEELQAISARSVAVLAELNHAGHDIQWVHSFVTDNGITCVYLAPSEEILREHAMKGPFPIDAVTPVRAMIDPLSAEKPS